MSSSSNYKPHIDRGSPLTATDSANNRNGPSPRLEKQSSADPSSQDSELLKAYKALEFTTLELGDAASMEDIEDRCDRLCQANFSRQDRLDRYGMALEVIRSERSTGAKLQRMFLNWTPEERRFYVLSATFWIALSLLCIAIGTSVKIDCDENCSHQEYCNRTVNCSHHHLQEHCNTTFDVNPCFMNCRARHWIVALSGVIILDFLLLVVVGATLYFSFAECCNCEGIKNKSSRETFTIWGRLLVLSFCIALLIGSLGTMLKLSAKQDGIGPAFLKTMPWQGVFAFGYFAYFLFCVSYLLKIWVSDFLAVAKKSGVHKALVAFGFGANVISALCPLAFFILVGINVDRQFGDKFSGFTIVTPLLVFFFLRIVSALIIPCSDGFVAKVIDMKDARRILCRKATWLIVLYILCLVGLVLAAMTVNEQRIDCANDVFWRWVIAMIPMYVFFGIIVLVSFFLLVGLKCFPEKAINFYNSLTCTIIELVLRPSSQSSNPTPSTSTSNLHQQEQQQQQEQNERGTSSSNASSRSNLSNQNSIAVPIVENTHSTGLLSSGDHHHHHLDAQISRSASGGGKAHSRRNLENNFDDNHQSHSMKQTTPNALSRSNTNGANDDEEQNNNKQYFRQNAEM